MQKLIVLLLMIMAALSVLCQDRPGKYEPGTVIAVVRHQETEGDAAAPLRYDVSVKVGGTLYVVLYTPPNGSNIVEFRVGAELPVLVGDKSIKYPDLHGITREFPILRKSPAAARE